MGRKRQDAQRQLRVGGHPADGGQVFAVVQPQQTLGDLVRERRQDAGLTQKQLAEQGGVSIRTLRNIEKNLVGPHGLSVRRLADVLGLAEPERGSYRPPQLWIGVLGPLVVRRGDHRVNIHSHRQRCLLGRLALQTGQAVSREELVDVLWGARPPRTCLDLVTTHVGRLRELLEPNRRARKPTKIIGLTRSGYLLELRAEHVDITCFDEFARRAREARSAGDLEQAQGLFGQALARWRGPVLADVGAELSHHPAAVAAWQRRLDVAAAYADVSLHLGRHEQAVAALRAVTANEPLHEGLHSRLMLALAAAGQQATALEQFTTLRRRLADELGIEPGREVQAAHARVLRQDLPAAELRTRTSPEGTGGGVPRPEPPGTGVPAQLPANVASFVGRTGYLRQLDALLPGKSGRQAANAVVIGIVAGTAGVGKTALVVHWAHRVRERFPDGQLYVNLRGFNPSGSMMDPADAVRGFLDAFAVPLERIPVSLEAQAALYRSQLAGRRVLIVLDNARDAEQVRPLLPGSPGSLVLITSRNQLPGLVAEGACPLTMDLLSVAEARQLLSRRLGPDRLAAESSAADEIIIRCARLPLALAVMAARAALNPTFPLAVLASELREAGGGLDVFDGGDRAVRAVFSWSYRTLNPGAARLFRLLGLHPGPDIATPAAASLAGVPAAEIRPLLAELTIAHLISEHIPGRYTFHDLLRTYAAEQAHIRDTDADRRAAVGRILDHYRDTAHAAALLIEPHRPPWDRVARRPDVVQEELATQHQALAWYAAERPVLLASLRHTTAHRLDTHTWRLACAMTDFFERHGHWQNWAATTDAALDAARRLGDRAGQAHVHRSRARALAWLGRGQDAQIHLRHALDLYAELGDDIRLAHTHRSLAWLLGRQGAHREALRHAETALALHRAADDDRAGQALDLNAVGWQLAKLGDHDRALTYCEQAVALFREIGDGNGAAHALDSLGYVHHRLGDHAAATAPYQQALDLFRQTGNRYYEADTLIHLGDSHQSAGVPDSAENVWKRALAILDTLSHPEADQVRAKLAGASSTAASSP